MGHWGYVFLAYGIVWAAILIYLATLRSRLKKVETELRLIDPSPEPEAARDPRVEGPRR
jgi:CcmD family protein